MKCVENVSTGKILRVTDEEAHELTKTWNSLWVYVGKKVWKAYRAAYA